MQITVNPELKAYIDPLTQDEHDALERSLLSEGCRDALVLWGDVLVDGHNRYGICQKHGLPFETVQNPRFQSLEDVHLWMIDQHLGRRSVSDFQRGVLALRKREIIAERRARLLASTPAPGDLPPEADALPPQDATGSAAPPVPEARPLNSREDIAKAARLSSSQVVMIEKIQKQAMPEVVEALKAGAISLNAAAAVASLPEEEQKAAALAGKEELKLAAKRVRDARKKPPAESAEDTAHGAATAAPDELSTLRTQVSALQAENTALRQQVAALQAQLQEAQVA
ncbi:plasmid replication/partition related protein [Hydrogenophaga sp. BPS33]|uniref:plasmid replication/partition related protein n=1 Tax=Hydrogenophaga sp. BPS33 TaxID=2651974 RepID=UPI00131F6C45|nr:plasmid replication/partition related protein [Hydrogenophaga sp. BPS33]QHE85653.1 plasmid replication/partition related protein [Hydrogenophaga sp. BPS33]